MVNIHPNNCNLDILTHSFSVFIMLFDSGCPDLMCTACSPPESFSLFKNTPTPKSFVVNCSGAVRGLCGGDRQNIFGLPPAADITYSQWHTLIQWSLLCSNSVPGSRSAQQQTFGADYMSVEQPGPIVLMSTISVMKHVLCPLCRCVCV